MTGKRVVFATNEDFIARGLYRLLETKEASLGSEVEWTTPRDTANADLVCSVLNVLAVNNKLAGRAKGICGRQPFADNRVAVDCKFVSEIRHTLTADSQIVVEGEDGYCCVSRVAPLRAASILNEVVRHRFN